MNESWDEADEIFQSVNEEMSEQDQEILMELFSKEDHLLDPYLYNAVKKNGPGLEVDPHKSNLLHLDQIAKLEALIDPLTFLDNKEDVSFLHSGGYKRKIDNLELNNYKHRIHESQYLDKFSNNEHIGISSDHDTGINAPPRKRQKTTVKNPGINSANDWKISSVYSSAQAKNLDNGYRSSQIVHAKRKRVSNYFRNQLIHLQMHIGNVPWNSFRKEDFINWPKNLPIKSPEKYTPTELKILLLTLEQIRFSEDYILLQKGYKSSNIEKEAFKSSNIENERRKRVSDYFSNQLEDLHVTSGKRPWNYLRKEDFINWPKNLPIKSPEKYTPIELKILLLTLEQIRFSDNYKSKISKSR